MSPLFSFDSGEYCNATSHTAMHPFQVRVREDKHEKDIKFVSTDTSAIVDCL